MVEIELPDLCPPMPKPKELDRREKQRARREKRQTRRRSKRKQRRVQASVYMVGDDRRFADLHLQRMK
jgi:hypothetical protein